MTNIKLIVTGAKARAEVDGVLTSGAVGIPVTIQYDSIWNGLTKNLVCRCGKWEPTGAARTILGVDGAATVAHEVMIAGNTLYLGIEGYNAEGTLVIPTMWASCGTIHPGADSDADPSADPALPIWAQLEQRVETLEEHDGDADEAVRYTAQKLTDEQKAQARDNVGALPKDHNTSTEAHEDIRAKIKHLANYVTPQMFGAVGDGVTDDTAAVQAALDNGGLIYFPAGRYKVTSQLTAVKSGKISMCKPYPCTYKGDYPLTGDDNWMGARIETHSTDGYGLLIGDGVEVDGLYMRAMDSFAGVLFKFDGSVGCATYPSQIRLSHIRLDNNSIYTVPEAMFDFVPFGSYFGILDDITIGSLRGRQFCEYGFRSVMTTTDTNWGNSMRIRNLCIDLLADYSLYIEGGPRGAGNWVFEHPSVQAYPYVLDDSGYIGKTGHINLVTLKNMQNVLILGGVLWDMHAATVTGDPILVENTDDISCFGCDSWFNAVETVLTGKLQEAADSLNISSLTMSVSGVEETGANRLKLSDGKNEHSVDIPSVSISDEQLDNSIAKWFDENAAPTPTVGRNKFNPLDNETLNGYFYAGNGGYESSAGMTTSHFIEAKYGDVIRIGKAGNQISAYHFHFYDAEKNWLGYLYTADSAAARTIEVENTAYIRICWTSGTFAYADRATAEICVTVNNTNITYEPYGITYEGGIGSYIVLQSPDGTQFQLSVADDGTLTATPVNSDGSDTEPDTTIEWKISDRTAVTTAYASPAAARTIKFDTYLLGVTSTGYWNGTVNAPTVTLSGEDFTMTPIANGYGVGVPYELTAGKTYRISFDADAACELRVSYYDAEGVYATYETIVTGGSSAGTYTKEFTAKDYAYPVLTFLGTNGSSVTFSNIVLEGVAAAE